MATKKTGKKPKMATVMTGIAPQTKDIVVKYHVSRQVLAEAAYCGIGDGITGHDAPLQNFMSRNDAPIREMIADYIIANWEKK